MSVQLDSSATQQIAERTAAMKSIRTQFFEWSSEKIQWNWINQSEVQNYEAPWARQDVGRIGPKIKHEQGLRMNWFLLHHWILNIWISESGFYLFNCAKIDDYWFWDRLEANLSRKAIWGKKLFVKMIDTYLADFGNFILLTELRLIPFADSILTKGGCFERQIHH